MATFKTIHLFGFGTAQIIGEEFNLSAKAETLTKLAAFVDHVKSFKPADVTLTDHHVIHIFEGMDVRYLGVGAEDKKAKTDFSVKFEEVNATLLTELATEIKAVAEAEEAAAKAAEVVTE